MTFSGFTKRVSNSFHLNSGTADDHEAASILKMLARYTL